MHDARTLLDRPEPIVFMDTAGAHGQVYPLQCDPGGIAVRVIRGWKCGTAPALHDEIAAALQFPSYYGENWDALNDCILDLDWMPADGYLLHLAGVERVLPDDERGFEILMRILRDAAEYWADPVQRGLASVPSARTLSFRTLVSGTAEGIERARRVVEALPARHATEPPRPITECTLEELEGYDPADFAFPSPLVKRVETLWRVPLGQLGIEDLRLIIGQRRALRWLLPLALARLADDPLAEGDLYPGDLLAAVLRLPDELWSTQPSLHQAASQVAARAAALLGTLRPEERGPVDAAFAEQAGRFGA